jgi:hypothetical protein
MNNEIIELLDEELRSQLENLSNLEQGSQEHSAAVESITKLYKVKLDEIKNQQDYEEKLGNDKKEEQLKKTQLKQWFIELCIKHGVEIGLAIVTLIAYGAYFNRGLKFEETGTFVSPTVRNLTNNFKPRRK